MIHLFVFLSSRQGLVQFQDKWLNDILVKQKSNWDNNHHNNTKRRHRNLADILAKQIKLKQLSYHHNSTLRKHRNLADDSVLVDEVSNTALDHSVPGRACLPVRELKSQAVEVIVPKEEG